MRIADPIHANLSGHSMTSSLLLILLLAVPVVRASDPLSDTLQQGLLAEEVHHDLDAAIAAYRSVLARHDEQRRLVATALFRLGECYRKLGKTTDTIAQYQRLLAEFSDQAELARLSRQGLQTLGAGIPVPTGPLTPAAQRQKDLLAQELALVEQQIAEVRAKVSVGAAGSIDLIPLQREALSLQRQMAALDDARRPDLLRDVVLPSTAPVESFEMADGVSEEESVEIERLKETIRNSPDLINSTTRGDPPLHAAAGRGQLAVARFLIENGAELDLRTIDGKTPLHRAVYEGHKAMTELLVAAGAQANASTQMGRTPLHEVAQRGFLELARVLLVAGADVNASASEEGTPLHNAVMGRKGAMIDLLLDSGADLETPTSIKFGSYPGYTPLSLALRVNYFDPSIVALLLARGANVNATNAAGDSVLHTAIELGESGRALRAILEKGPDLEPRGSQNLTPLQLACVNRSYAAVRILLEAGADPNATDNNGYSPLLALAAAVAPSARQGLAIAMDPVVIRLLLDAGADPNVSDKDGMSLLQHALRLGSLDLVAALLPKHVNPNTADPTGATPIHAAALWSDASAIRLLLDHGAEIDLRDQFGNTPLHVAARAGSKEVVQLLLNRGVPVDARNEKGRTPLNLVENSPPSYFATEPGRGLIAAFDRQGRQVRPVAAPPPAEIAELLIKHGAEGSVIKAPPQSISPFFPSGNPSTAVDPAHALMVLREKELQSKANRRSAADPENSPKPHLDSPSTATAASDSKQIAQTGGIAWEKWDAESVDRARAARRPVLVNFTADWCMTCQSNKETSLEIQSVADKLKGLDAAVFLGDYTQKDPGITAELQRWGRSGVPLVLVYPKDRDTPPRVLPEVLTPEIVLDALDWAAN